MLNTPTEGSEKNWISQGYTADKALVVADLIVPNEENPKQSFGPHAFLIDFRDNNGRLINGIEITDMGRKSVGNDLDNAAIKFTDVILSKDTLLNKYAGIGNQGQYMSFEKNMHPMYMIGQRLFSGRVAVAWAAMTFRKQLYKQTKTYSDNKSCLAPNISHTVGAPLTNIPQLRNLYLMNDKKVEIIEDFLNICEKKLSECLYTDELPSAQLTEAIAVAKVLAVEDSIEMVHKLKQEVGSYALMEGTGFEQSDFLQCCKFAEGDSKILMQKMARDLYRLALSKGGHDGMKVGAAELKYLSDDETLTLQQLYNNITRYMKENEGATNQEAWDDQYMLVFSLANYTMDRIVRDFK